MSDRIEAIIDALRKKLLDAAVRGELVDQDASEEPASALLERIAEERAALPGKRKAAPASRIERRPNGTFEVFPDGSEKDISDEIPFDIPESWEWVRVGELVKLISGQDLTPKDYHNEQVGIPYITGASNFDRGKLIINRWTTTPKSVAVEGSILLTCKGTIGELAILHEEKVHIARQVMAICPLIKESTGFILYLLHVMVKEYKNQAQSMIPGISRSVVLNTYAPFPPLQEQHRIVNSLESQLKQLDNLRESHRRMRRILSETPTSLRQQLLQAAIEGKIVAQDPKDEPASALLERIAKERAALPGKRKAAPSSRIERRRNGTFEIFPDGSEKDISDEIPFDIPVSWEWSRFGDICINRDSERVPLSMHQRSKQTKIFDYYGASGVIDKVEKFIFEGRFLLIGEDGANLINRSTDIAFFAEGQFWVNNHAHVLSAYSEMPLDFICSYINGISLTSFVSGTAQPKLTQAKLNSILVPIPPAREQHRIMQQLKKVLSIANQS